MKAQLYEKPVCDFCSSAPSWRYPAKDFRMEGDGKPPAVSQGDWLACDECAALIESNDREALRQRGLKTPMGEMLVGVVGQKQALSEVRQIHERFFKNRSGRVRMESV